MRNSHFREQILIPINIYIMLRYLWPDKNDFDLKYRDLINNNFDYDVKLHSKINTLCFTLMGKIVNSVEVFIETRSNPLRRIWFPVIPVCHYLNEDTKNSFLNRVDRSNTQTKVSSLISSSRDFVTQMKQDYNASKKGFKINAERLFEFIGSSTNLLAIAINLINLFTLKYFRSAVLEDHVY